MDSGAHFHRCDFQVHTPRDINWTGMRPVEPKERKLFAQQLISACHQNGLDAIAITDHHDLGFFHYIKEAALEETDEQGRPVPAEHQIVVFPGIEMTLGVPCQALLILDAGFPLDLLSNLPTILSVQANASTEATHAPIVRLDDIKSLVALCEILDRTSYIRGRYIVLPNVSEGGTSTLLRSGFAGRYCEMPCVGGYLDGSLDQLGEGNRQILAGKSKEWGFKALGVFQTSDSRSHDFKDLRRHSSWIKWAVPRAEALRQACLARKTRIADVPPRLPSVVIQSLDVSNSRFMGPFNIEFNPQLNCLIGGRGTGKSTALEYLRWALCDQPPAVGAGEEVPDFQRKRANLIENTLLPFEGVVSATFVLNQVPHVIRRNSRTNQVLLKIGSSEFQERSEDDVRRLLPIQAYSQKQLSAVGVRQEELHRFVRSTIEKELADIRREEDELKSTLRRTYGQIHAKSLLQRQIDEESLELQSITQQVRMLREQLVGITDEDRGVISLHEPMMSEEQFVRSLDRGLESLRSTLTAAMRNVENLTVGPVSESLPNRALLTQIHRDYEAILRGVREQLARILGTLGGEDPLASEYRALRGQWDSVHEAHNQRYETAKTRASAQEGRLAEIASTEQRIRALTDSVDARGRRLTEYGSPEQDYESARSAWTGIYQRRADLLEAKCRELSELSEGLIRATLRRGAGVADVQGKLEQLISGTRIRTQRIKDLCDRLSGAADPVAEWNLLLQELEALANISPPEEGAFDLPPTSLLAAAGFGRSDLERIGRKLTPEEWLELSLSELEDTVVFEYKQREGDYIRFADASAGQQATGLLRVLLKQEGPPLIIDQPEEDLDNQVILDIVEDLWAAKNRRQVLISSHNANLVVNGDADLVIVFDYRKAGDQSGGRIKAEGAIDVESIRTEITSVMEGGEKAFILRKEKYGF